MKLPIELAQKAVRRMSILKYFPSEPEARDEIADMLISMIEDDEYGTAEHKLEWFVSKVRETFGEWPGPREFRATYCSRWRPADEENQ